MIQQKVNKFILLLIFFSFCFSLIVSKHYLSKYDKLSKHKGHIYHQMIKADPLRYMGHGDEISQNIKEGKNFFKTGRENYTKYLPPRIASLYFLIFNESLYDKKTGLIKTGIYFPYLFLQCLFFYSSILYFYFVIKDKFSSKINFFIIGFLSLEPTIFQYHGTFWSESIFFSIQIFILAFLFKEKKNNLNFLIMGALIGILSLQKQYAIFFIIPIILGYLVFEKQEKLKKISFLIFGFFILQFFLGINNYVRSGNFHVLTADMKHGAHMDLIAKVMSKKMNITSKEFNIIEGKAAKLWLDGNKITYNKNDESLIEEKSLYNYRDTILNESDKVNFDNFIAERSIKYFKENIFDFIKFIIKQSMHVMLLNPFHIYSDHNFVSGEIYYYSELHDKLIPYRIFYTILIYFICILGIVELYKLKKYEELSFLFLSLLYFYSLVSWHGNTRYFVPCVIYLSIFFSFGIVKISTFYKKLV